MAKTGRPKSSVIKDKIVTIRMSDGEYQKLREYAGTHGMTVTELIKKGVGLAYLCGEGERNA